MNTNLQRHPLSALLPALTAEETDGLRESIRTAGVIDRIVLYEGQVLDGWNRYSLSIELGVDCPMGDLPEGVDPVELVRSKTRGRNMTQGQLATLEVSLRTWRPSGVQSSKVADAATLPTNADLARAAGVSERTIRSAKAVAKATDALKQAVIGGKVSVERGAQIAKLPPQEQERAIEQPPTPAAKVAAAAAMQPPADDMGDALPSTDELIAEQEKRIAELEMLVAAANADDAKAELVRWRQAHMAAERRQAELMQRVTEREAELQRLSTQMRRIGRAVGVDDPRKVAAAVEQLAKAVKAAA